MNKLMNLFDAPWAQTTIKSDKVTLPEMILGYFIGPFGALLASGIMTSFLNRYWTDVLFADQKLADGSLPAGINTFLTLLPLLSSVLIVAGNLIVGQMIERTHTKAGKARPWILVASVLLGASCALMFITPSKEPAVKMVLTALSYNIYYSVAYPLYNTSNSTLIPVSTRNSEQRGLLASLTNFAGLAVMGTGGMVFPMIIAWFMGGWENPSQKAWTVTFVGIGILTFLITVLQYFFTRERVTEESMGKETGKAAAIPLKSQLDAVTSDSFWWIIIGIYLLFQFSGAFKNLSITYFCSQHFGATAVGGDGAMAVINILGAVPMAAAMAVVIPLSNRFGKRMVALVGMIIGVAGGVVAGIFADNFVIVCIGIAMKSFGSSPVAYTILAMIADVLDHIEAGKGYRCDGFTMSIYSSLMAAATPVATGLFNAISGGGAKAGAVTISYIWIETAAYALCAVLLTAFTVEKHLPEDRIIIQARQK